MKRYLYGKIVMVLAILSVMASVSTLPPSEAGSADVPILIISSASNHFSGYYAEILRTEGFNAFNVNDISSVSSSSLASYDVVILGEMPLTAAQAAMLGDWVSAGGNLIAMRPDKKLAGLLGLTDTGVTLSNAYLLVDTSDGPGLGIVNVSLQFHGSADRYALNGATRLATLYSNPNTATSNPAVTLNSAGMNGGHAAAFTYDLARSIIYTRQGNPAWAGQERDGFSPIRANDLFFGNASFDPQPDWIDLDKAAIPQADEQQRLLANLIIRMNSGKKPLPRFWYFPRNLPAVVVMTGDDHANGGTAGRFDSYVSSSPSGCSVQNWECIRSTSYVFTNTPLSNAQASSYNNAGFEVALHVDTNCSDWTPSSLESFFTSQLGLWGSKYTSLPPPVTNRTHCITWSDYVTQALVSLNHGIRLDTNYYYWPPEWVDNRPGFFTGSGMPMRFADSSGALIDVYQAVTQMTDESNQAYPFTIDTLLDRAIGSQGYYGAFTVNAHTDTVASSVSDAVVSSARARGIPVISARQMLEWLDGRNGSTFSSLSWSSNSLYFSVNVAQGANGLVAMVPVPNGQSVTGIMRNGSSTPFTTATVKGIQYARFTAANGDYQVIYASDITLPVVSSVSPVNGASGVGVTANITATFSESMDPATINSGTFELRNPTNNLVPAAVVYDAATKTATLAPSGAMADGSTYTATVKGGTNGVKDTAGNPLANDFSWSFSTGVAPAGPYTIWPGSTVPGWVDSGPDSAVELGVKFRSDVNGSITGIRFYKAGTNTGTHVGNLWTNTGARLATATFSNESASGWQQVSFPTPVAITANTVYVASYHTNTGHYSDSLNFFSGQGVDSPPLHALADGVSGFNGVFAYGSSSSFPSQGWNGSNYWVDVLFSMTAPPIVTLQSIAVTPANPTILAGATQQFAATGNYSDNSTRNITGEVTWASSGTGVASINSAGLATAAGAGTATISAASGGITGSTTLTVSTAALSITTTSLPGGTLNVSYSATLAAGGGTPPFTWSIVGGSLPTGLSLNSSTGAISGIPTATGTFSFTVRVTDSGNPAQTVTKALSIAIATAQASYTIWPATTVPGLVDSGPDSAVELGVKFRSDSSGYITGIRFYKASTNSGAHIGNLWTSNGTLLATAIFSNETPSGWQQVNFSTPVAITTNTVYVASYHTNTGHYSDNLNYFSGQGVDSPPLHALADGVSGFNGVFAYGSSSAFPSQGWNGSNYWVDVLFSMTAPPAVTLQSIAVTPASPAISTGGTQQFTATGAYSDGSTKTITGQVTWASSNTAVATIGTAGLAAGVSAGTSGISATLGGVTGSAILTVQIPPLKITTSSLPNGRVGVAYSRTLAASGGAPPYTWSITIGSLPPGLALNISTGGISGTPAKTGTFGFTVQVTDSGNPVKTATKTLSIGVR